MKQLNDYMGDIIISREEKVSLQVTHYTFQNFQEAQHLATLIAAATNNPNENLVICELLNNAIEHGNLGISYEEKSELLEQDKFLEEIERRMQLPENIHKQADVTIEKYQHKMIVTITDQGNGFDYSKYLAIDQSRLFESHGRGIAIANSILKIQYLEKGNVVKVYFQL